MTPADGAADFATAMGDIRRLSPSRAILLHGGRTLLLFENVESAPPASGFVLRDGVRLNWLAHCWQDEAEGPPRWHAIAVLDHVPTAECEIVDQAARGRWRLDAAPNLDVAPEPLAELVRRTRAAWRGVFAFLVERLVSESPAGSAAAISHRRFIRSFACVAAGRDGFIEVIARPDTGGVFVQGWSMSLAPGQTAVTKADEDLALTEVDIATFDRDDILSPAKGFCLFAKSWDLAELDGLFFEQGGALLRLDAVQDVLVLTGTEATAHVADMLPRMQASEQCLRAFRRVCRPRFLGEDTLSSTTAPIACALDAVMRAPDGTLLTIGWLLDPLRRVQLMLLKSTGSSLYCRLDVIGCPLPRPDLVAGFARDPRFAQLLNEWDVMHGFVAHVPTPTEPAEATQLYLELVLDDGSCLFQPITATPFESVELLPTVLSTLAPAEPERSRIVEDHVAPFLASVPRGTPRFGRAARPLRLGGQGERETLAVVPFKTYAQVQPILALLAGTPDAAMLDLALVTSRGVAAEAIDRLGAAFEFYGLGGCLVIAPENAGTAAQMDLGSAASDAERVLAWMPSALPKAPGWLPRLLSEHDALPTRGLLSPVLTYEDGSIHFGGVVEGGGTACALSGYGATWLSRGAPKRTPVGASEVTLIERAMLARVEGFSGRLLGDAFAHIDLADRLARAGLATWCSGAVEFWMLDDHLPDEATSLDRTIRQIDAALLGKRGRALRELAA